MSKQAVAYLRKSKVTSDRHVSWEVQEHAIKELAERHGDADPMLLSDWSRSGRGQFTHRRPDYLRLRAMIEAGEVSVVYSYSLSRLARSLSEYASLAELCQKHGVKVRLAKEGEQDFSTASGRFIVGILALLAQMEAEIAAERAQDTTAHRRERGDYLGVPPFGSKVVDGALLPNPEEDIEAVVGAYQEVGSFLGAAKLLTTRGVQTRSGEMWNDITVARILRRDGRLSLPVAQQGAKHRADWLFYRLLRCPFCGTLLTAQTRERPRYFCSQARRDPFHPRPYAISEFKIIDWLQAEASLLRTPDAVRLAEQNDEKRAELLTRRERLGWAVADGLLDRGVAQVRAAELDEELDALNSIEKVVRVPTVDWTWPAAELNAVLRTIWEYVDLDEAMQPVRAQWRVPEWRQPQPPAEPAPPLAALG